MRCARGAFILELPAACGPSPIPAASLPTDLLRICLSWLRATGRLVGRVTESGHAGMIPNRFSLSICRNHHSFWPHIRPSNRAPHWKTPTGRPRTYWTRPRQVLLGSEVGVSDDLLTAGHHTTLVWFQGTNPLKWLISFFPQSKFFTNQTWNLENITELLGILIVT